jgi:hypothetical protein
MDQMLMILAGKRLDQEFATLDKLGIISGEKIDLVCRLRGGGFPAFPPLETAELVRVVKQRSVSSILNGHSVEGCWLDAEDMVRRAGLAARPELPVLLGVAPDAANKAVATILALAILRKLYQDQRELWRLLEAKALNWLARIAADVDWSVLVDTISFTLRESLISK